MFALERATCSYSGASLWILDYGADPDYAIDWADHVVPASRGGESTLENAALASWIHNYVRGANTMRPLFLLDRGRPTRDFYLLHPALSAELAAQLARFSRLHPTDWYLNRGLWHVWLGSQYLLARDGGTLYRRDTRYRAVCALKQLRKWRKMTQEQSVASVAERGLLLEPVGWDQRALLAAAALDSESELEALMHELFPAMRASSILLDLLGDAEEPVDLEDILEVLDAGEPVAARVESRVRHSVLQMQELLRVE